MRRGILLLLNHELSIEGKKKEKEKRRGETRKLESFLSNEIIQSRSPIRSAKIQDWKTWIEPSGEKKKRDGRKGKSFFLPPGREIMLISARLG